MFNHCLDTMTIFNVVLNGKPLRFVIDPQSFIEHFKDRTTFTICHEYDTHQFIASINGLLNFIANPYSDADDDIFHDPIIIDFIKIAFKKPEKYVTDNTTLLDDYNMIYKICSGSNLDDIPYDLFKKMIGTFPGILPVVSCIITKDNRMETVTKGYFGYAPFNGSVEIECVTGPMCFFKNYGPLEKLKVTGSPIYAKEYDNDDNVLTLYRMLRYMLIKDMSFTHGIFIDEHTQMTTLLSGKLFSNVVDTIDFDKYVEYCDSLSNDI